MSNQDEIGFRKDDYIGLASLESRLASEAIESGNFDKAWGHYQKVIVLRAKGAEKYKFTKRQTIESMSNVHIALARMLTKENRHDEALMHILYYVAGSNSPLSANLKIYRPYVNRCKFADLDLTTVTAKLNSWKDEPDLVQIRDTVTDWKSTKA